MIARRPRAFSRETYDVLVIGGGIYGAVTALEAARRGWRALLLEKADFGGATSWNNFRIVHGGLRYLQRMDLPRFRESVVERRWFLKHFPDLVQPIACLMPLYGEGLRRPWVLRQALRLNDCLSRRRNDGLRADRHLAPGRILGVEETKAQFPDVDARGLRGAVLWHDASMQDSQRVLVETLHWACHLGARCLNYVEALDLVCPAGRLQGVRARDVRSGAELEFRARWVVNAAGPWSRTLARHFDRDVPALFRPSLAFNLLLDRPALAAETILALAPRRRAGAAFFLRSWKGRLFAGTYHAPWKGSPEGPVPTPALVSSFLEELNALVPGLRLEAPDVRRVHAGLLPAAREGTAELAGRAVICDHAKRGGPRGLYSVSGVKFTTARAVAERTLRLVARSAQRRLPAASDGAPPPLARPPGAEEMARLIATSPDAARQVVRRAVEEEAVLTVDDLLLRRTDWSFLPRPTSAWLSVTVQECL